MTITFKYTEYLCYQIPSKYLFPIHFLCKTFHGDEREFNQVQLVCQTLQNYSPRLLILQKLAINLNPRFLQIFQLKLDSPESIRSQIRDLVNSSKRRICIVDNISGPLKLNQ